MKDQHELPIQENGAAPLSGKVKGYVEPGEERIALVNQNKKLEELLMRRIDELRAHGSHDPRWLASAKTDIERGFMCMNRAIFQPTRIDGDLDI